MTIVLVVHDAPRTGATLFADALGRALEGLAPISRCVVPSMGPRAAYVVANSLAAFAGLPSCDAVIVHEHPWWLATRPELLKGLRSTRPLVFTVSPGAGALIRGCTDLNVRPVPRRITPTDASPAGRRPTGDPTLRLLGSGTVSLTKGVDSWLQVVATLAGSTAVSARWIGAVPHTRYATEMLADVERLGLSARVSFEGLVAEVGPLYRWADALLVTSRFEAHCASIDEARACGTAVVAFADAFDRERVRSGDAVWIERFSVPAMAHALSQTHAARPVTGPGSGPDLVRTDFRELARAIVDAANGGRS